MKHYYFIIGIIIGLIGMSQVNSHLLSNRVSNIHEKIDQKKIINTLNTEQKLLKQDIKNLREEEKEKEKFLDPSFQAEINKLEKLSALKEVKGKGLLINYKDLENTDYSIINQELSNLINTLFALNIKDISLNGYRLNHRSSLVFNNNYLLLDKYQIIKPYQIKLVTENPDFILKSLNEKDLFKQIKEKVINKKRSLEIITKPEITLPAYFN
jgi:uncharacterized protein YlxW (UPF0749 family)